MLFTHTKELADVIVETLAIGSFDGATLLSKIQTLKKTTSKETFYRVLRKLLTDEVVIKNKRMYLLNSRWLEQVYELSKPQAGKEPLGNGREFLVLEDGNQITYNFKNAKSMYNYWAYIFDAVYQAHDHTIPVLIYHSHEWFMYGREEAERLFYGRFTKTKQLAFVSVGDKTQLTKKVKSDWSNEFLKMNVGFDLGQPKTEYINIVGNFIFKVSMSNRFAKDMDVFFKTYTEVTKENIGELMQIVERADKAKLIFKHSKKEADLWKAKFRKYFIFPK